MSYVRLNLSDGQVFNASHVSHIEDGIEDCETQLSEVNQSLTDFKNQVGAGRRYSSMNTFLNDIKNMNDYDFMTAFVSESLASTMSNGELSNTSCAIIFINVASTPIFQYLIFTMGTSCYVGRWENDAPSTLTKL